MTTDAAGVGDDKADVLFVDSLTIVSSTTRISALFTPQFRKPLRNDVQPRIFEHL